MLAYQAEGLELNPNPLSRQLYFSLFNTLLNVSSNIFSESKNSFAKMSRILHFLYSYRLFRTFISIVLNRGYSNVFVKYVFYFTSEVDTI